MGFAARDRLGRAPRAQIDGGRRRAADVGVGATVPQLSVGIVAPALDRTVVKQRTHRTEGGRKSHGRAPRTEGIDGCGRVLAGGREATAELTLVVLTPAFHRSIIEDGAIVVSTRVNAGCGAPRTQIDRLRGVFVATAGPKLTCVVSAPTHDGPVIEQSARVPVAKSKTGSVVSIGTLDAGERGHVLALVARLTARSVDR